MKVARALIGMNFQEDTVQKNVKLIIGYMAYIFSIAVASNIVLSELSVFFELTGKLEILLIASVIFATTWTATCIAIKLGLLGNASGGSGSSAITGTNGSNN